MLVSSILTELKIRQNHNNNHFYRRLLTGTALAVVMAAGMMSHPSHASPTGGVVTQGAGSITTAGTTTNITQTTPRAAINWQKFDVGSDETVQFTVPDHGATLNYIKAGEGHSQILGTVTSNATLYFVNQNGFVFGPNSNVTAQNLVISTQNIDLSKFIAAKPGEAQPFAPSQDAGSKIILQGRISTPDHGVVAVFGPNIETYPSATLAANRGTVILAAGTVATLELPENGFARFGLTSQNGVHAVRLDGLIQAGGGQVSLAASSDANSNAARIENNGTIDIAVAGGQGGKVGFDVNNGVIALGDGKVKTGQNGEIVYHHIYQGDRLVIDANFLKSFHSEAGLKLDVTTNQAIIYALDRKFGEQNSLALHSDQGVEFTRPITAEAIVVRANYFKVFSPIIVGSGGLDVATTGENLPRGRSGAGIEVNIGNDRGLTAIQARNGGKIDLIAANDGRVFVQNAIIGYKISATGGGIGFNGTVTAADTLKLQATHFGNIWLEGDVTANNASVTAEGGSIVFLRKLTAPNPDGKSGDIFVAVKSRNKEIIFRDAISVTNLRVENKEGQIFFTHAITSNDASGLPNKIQVFGENRTVFSTDVGVRPGGLFELNVGDFLYHNITANNASISITINNPNFGKTVHMAKYSTAEDVSAGSYICANYQDCFDSEFGGHLWNIVYTGTYFVSLDIDNHIKFDNAPSAFFKAPHYIDVYNRITAHNLTLISQNNHFVYRSRVIASEGGNIKLVQYDAFHYTPSLALRFGGNGGYGANLSFTSYHDTHIDAPIILAQGKNLALAGRNVFIDQDVVSNGGKITLVYNSPSGELEFPRRFFHEQQPPINAVFGQSTYKHLKFNGDANLALVSYDNLAVNADEIKLSNLAIEVRHNGGLTLDGAIAVKNQMNLTSVWDIWVNQPLTSEAGADSIHITTPSNKKFLHLGHDGRIGL
ncbi:MAG: filamentous hemagglutinin N-terminal domain-containing protein [Candidatus Symbiobacter sp.]|nr:filamentous hemagglutinin N-terminal domain-containing protein [Candidatus Symbiobacter sp.]